MKKPKPLVDLINVVARYAGYEVLPSWRIPCWPLAALLRDLFQAHEIDCVLDVGANRGHYVDFLREHVGYTGQVVSFEPIGEHARSLRAKAAGNDAWRICDFALGQADSSASLNIMRSDDLSSFLRPQHERAPEFSRDNTVVRVEEVNVRRLDSALEELKIDPRKKSIYLKMDTQGFDLQVVAGATQSLPHLRALQSEVSCIPIYEKMPDILETIRTLRDLNFQLAGLHPVNHREDFSVVEFDAVFVNTSLVHALR